MPKILIAWELGANYGHLTRTIPIAEALRERGHWVEFAVSDLEKAHQMLSPRGFRFYAAPVARIYPKLSRPPGNYAELLIAEGYGDKKQLESHTAAWLNLLDSTNPNIIILHHAPIATLVAYIRDLPIISVGNSFEIPSHPLPSIRQLTASVNEELKESERTMVANINSILEYNQVQKVTTLYDLFSRGHIVFLMYPEIDHFGPRQDGAYVGQLHLQNEGVAVEWPATKNKKVYAYFRSNYSAAIPLIQALQHVDAISVCVVDGLSKKLADSLTRQNVIIYTDFISDSKLTMGADLVIAHGSGLTSIAISKGVPVLALPHTAEHGLHAQRIEGQSLGLIAEPRDTTQVLHKKINILLSDQKFTHEAKRFSEKYKSLTVESAISKIVAQIEDSISTKQLN